jgi:hypothetical protein
MSWSPSLKFSLALLGPLILVFGACYWFFVADDSPPEPKTAVKLAWDSLATLNYKSGEIPGELAKIHGQQVQIPGFMVPLEDDSHQVSEFILVPYQGACIHVPPPPPNQMVFVHMKNHGAEYTYLPVWVKGKMLIANTQSPYGVVSYEIEASSVELFKGRK